MNNDGATEAELLLAADDFETLGEYEDAQELAVQCRNKAKEVVERAYTNAREQLNEAKTSSEILFACEELEKLGNYKDCEELALNGRSQIEKYKKYENAVKCLNEANSVHQLMDVIEEFRDMGDFLDSKEMCSKAFEKIYAEAADNAKYNSVEKKNYAAGVFEAIKDYKDAEQRAQECRKRAEALNAEKIQDEKDADELELQYCLNILDNPKAQIAEVEAVQDRLVLIKEHEGVEEALEECRKRLPVLRKKHKRNIIIRIAVVCSIIALIIFLLAFAPSIRNA